VGNPLDPMRDLGQKNDRRLIYIQTKSADWRQNLPTSNWLVLPIGHNRDKGLITDITDNCLNNGVKYVCTLGKECEFIHDFFDDSIVDKRIEKGLSVSSEDDFEYEPMTTWHNDFDKGVWFAIHAAHDDHVDIDKVVFLDMTDNGELERIQQAIEKD
jgi:hypothetical protein